MKTPLHIGSTGPVIPVALDPYDRITLRNTPYCRPEHCEGGWKLRRADAPDLTEIFSHADLRRLMKEPGYAYDRLFYDPSFANARVSSGADGLHDLAARETTQVLFRYEWVTRFVKLEAAEEATRSNEGIERALEVIQPAIQTLANARIQSEHELARGKKKKRVDQAQPSFPPVPTPSIRTFQRWLRKYEECGHAPWSLRDGRGRSDHSASRITGKARELLEAHGNRYVSTKRPSYVQIRTDLENEVASLNKGRPEHDKIACPSMKALRRYIKSLGAFFVYAGRYGLEAAKRRFAIVNNGPDVVRPLQRVEMDHWEVHLQVILTEMGIWRFLSTQVQARLDRMHFCGAQDYTTKIILGAHLSQTPKASDVLRVLQMTVSDKASYARGVGAQAPWNQHGLGETFVTDTGGAFIDHRVRAAILDLGASQDFPPPATPQLRGGKERFFRTKDLVLISRFHGRTFENPAAKADYDSEALVQLTDAELAQAVCRWIVDVYHLTPHAGLDGETPIDAWNRLTGLYGVTPPPDRHKQRSIFGALVTRTLDNRGIRILGLYYWNEPLMRHFLQNEHVPIEVRVDPFDLGHISVRINGAWFSAKCKSDGFDDVAVETWVHTVHDLRAARGEAAAQHLPTIRAALAALRQIDEQSRARSGIAYDFPEAADIERAEREVFRSFVMPAGADTSSLSTEATTDFLAGGFSVGGGTSPTRLSSAEPLAPEQPASRIDEEDDDDDFSFGR